jgi:multidrug transporter EmrE-like cation transporter
MSLVDITMMSLVEIVGDFSLKQFANHGGIESLALGIGGYIGVVYFLIRSLQGSTVLLVNGAWDGVSTLIESVAAFVILGERFEHVSQYVGLLLIIVGLFLLKVPLKRAQDFQFPPLFSK